jgi:hypothetical protein
MYITTLIASRKRKEHPETATSFQNYHSHTLNHEVVVRRYIRLSLLDDCHTNTRQR